LKVVRRALYLIPFVALVSSLALANDAPLMGSIEAVKVVASHDGKETYVPAKEAAPKDVIEYRLTYANSGHEVLRHVSVTDPIPIGTEYVGQTATVPDGGTVVFSIDNGKTFHAWPIRVKTTDEDGTEVWSDATPDQVTHIRWTLAGELDPEAEIAFTYRAIIK
jgi:uncharacterized repeat protein (TIGR01451 family)